MKNLNIMSDAYWIRYKADYNATLSSKSSRYTKNDLFQITKFNFDKQHTIRDLSSYKTLNSRIISISSHKISLNYVSDYYINDDY